MPKARIVEVDFGVDATATMWRYVEETTEYWFQRTKNYRDNTLKEYARLYKGTPINKTKNTPWPNAANTVIQVCATHCDQLLSRVMAIYMTDPLWAAIISGDIDNGQGEDQRTIFETFMTNVAMSPTELDFYRVEQAWFSSAIRNGTGVIKFPWEYVVEDQLVFIEGAESGAAKFDSIILYDGPRPENVPLNKFLTNLSCQRLSDSNFVCHIRTLSRRELEDLKELGIYDNEKLDKIIAQPTRNARAVLQAYIESTQGLDDGSAALQNDEYDIMECWYTYWHNGTRKNLVAQHYPTAKVQLLAFYNFYPKNMLIFEDAKLAYDDDQYLGYGLVEMLKGYQEEIATTHNQRVDAGSLNNTTAFRVDPASKLHSILTFYPGVLVPAREGEIERLDTANVVSMNTDSENLTSAYAMARSGIDPATGGTGGGIVNNKRGIYSSQGTFAVMQQQNNRTSLRISDMRSAHARAGSKFAAMYSHFGIGSKLRTYGENAEILKAAFENIKNGKLGLAIRPATASINKELEKQNDILLSQTLERLYAGDAQIIQSLSMQGIPPTLQEYYVEVLRAKNSLMKHILRNFGHEDSSRLVPVPSFLKENKNGATSAPGQQQPPTQGNQKPIQQQALGTGDVPIGSGADTNILPTEPAGSRVQ